MKKLKITNINNYDYTLVDDATNNKYLLNIAFYDFKPNIDDIIYLDETILNENTFYTFGNINNKDKNINDKDIIKVMSKGKEIYLKRYYG